MDQKGYIMSGLSLLLIIPAIYLIIAFTDMTLTGSQSIGLKVESEIVLATESDIENNIPLFAEKTLQKTANNVIESGKPLHNSKITIINCLQEKMDNLTGRYSSEGINANCKIISVYPSQDPFNVQIKSTISINKDKLTHTVNLSKNISIIDPNYPIPDPLPFIKCKNFGGAKNTSTRILYGPSLMYYLYNENMHNSNIYLNTTSPLIFKKCPYDPYMSHGKSQNHINLKNCIENGYYHKSNDGSCFLCRLEGKGICPHNGIETFIIPSVSANDTLLYAPCSIDHVIFNDNYYGSGIIYHSNITGYYKIFLENGHREKYGLI